MRFLFDQLEDGDRQSLAHRLAAHLLVREARKVGKKLQPEPKQRKAVKQAPAFDALYRKGLIQQMAELEKTPPGQVDKVTVQKLGKIYTDFKASFF